MINLKRSEELDIYQVEMSLKMKTKHSPFISVLILAKELQELTSDILRQSLFVALPVRACENLLLRLTDQGYLRKNVYGNTYSLTVLGDKSAEDRSFWLPEKGVYNIYVSKSDFIDQKIIKIEKAERIENEKDNKVCYLPGLIKSYEKQIIYVDKTEKIIEDVDIKCFQLKPIVCKLEIQVTNEQSQLKVTQNNQDLYTKNLELLEETVRDELLMNHFGKDYNQKERKVFTYYNPENLTLKRNITLNAPVYNGNRFDSIELLDIEYMAIDKDNAILWYNKLLYTKIENYFLTDNSFELFANSFALPFNSYYDLEIPKRIQYAKNVEQEFENAFYMKVKLETIDYLNY